MQTDRHDHPEFDMIADEHRLNTIIGRSPVLPIAIRLRLLAGVATAMKNLIEQISLLRRPPAFGPLFDRVLTQDPIVAPDPILQKALNQRDWARRYQANRFFLKH